MLNRYTRAEMHQVWCDENIYKNWLNVELALCSAYGQVGRIPRSIASSIRSKAKFDISRMQELQAQGKQELESLLISVKESLEPEEAKCLHLGITISDIKDTALSLLIKQAAELIYGGLDNLIEVLKELAIQYKDTACATRVHGTYSEPTSFGLKILNYYDVLKRSREALAKEVSELCVGMFSGNNGAFTNLDTEIEKLACENLAIKPALISTQVLGRDRHATFVNHLAIIGSVLERLANEVRNLQRPEIAEVEEPFLMKMGKRTSLQHQRSPWRCETVSGLARVLRSYTQVAQENISIWHERDSSYNHSERVILPDACALLDYMIFRMDQVMRGLIVYPKNMYRNLFIAGGVVFGQQIVARLIDQGLDRDAAQDLIDTYSQRAWDEDESFQELISKDKLLLEHLNEEQIESCFKTDFYLRNVDQIFRAVFGECKRTAHETPNFVV